MDECSMTVIIQTDSYWSLTALSRTRMTTLTQILLVYFVSNIALLSHLKAISKQKSNMLAIMKSDLDSRHFAWCVQSLHMHRRIIMSHNLVTEIKNNLTCSKIRTQIAFHRYLTSKIQIYLVIPPLTQKPSPCLRLNSISMWWLAGEARCRGESLQVQPASVLAKVTNRALWRLQVWVYSCSTAASQNPASYDYFLVRKSLTAFAIFLGQCQDTT